MEKKLKSWQGWLLFGGSMVVVFVLGLCVSALMERRAEVASIFNNRKTRCLWKTINGFAQRD